jgi:hypothetical protein
MDWIATILTTLIGAMSGVEPIVYLCLIGMGGLGFGWFNEKEAADQAVRDTQTRYDTMVAAKDARFDAAMTSTQTALDEAHRQLAALNRDYSSANKDTSDVIAQIANTLATLSESMQSHGRSRA